MVLCLPTRRHLSIVNNPPLPAPLLLLLAPHSGDMLIAQPPSPLFTQVYVRCLTGIIRTRYTQSSTSAFRRLSHRCVRACACEFQCHTFPSSHACVSSCTSRYTRSHVLSVLTGQDRRDDNHLGMLVWLRTGAPARWARELRPHQRCWVIDRQFALQFGYALHNNDHAMQKKKEKRQG